MNNYDPIERPPSAATIGSIASSSSRKSNRSGRRLGQPPSLLPAPTLTPPQSRIFEACTSTAAFFIYAQQSVILSLHHDTLAVERRFIGHKDDVLWIEADNMSDRGGGRMIASYDNSMKTIFWDVMDGEEKARVEPYGDIRVAAWMKNGHISFGTWTKQIWINTNLSGNSHGNITLFDPYSRENLTVRTIFDPITALAPASDCQTFAIGYVEWNLKNLADELDI
jgi:hypothetical protein